MHAPPGMLVVGIEAKNSKRGWVPILSWSALQTVTNLQGKNTWTTQEFDVVFVSV
jgi:hypothetical protein